MDYISESEHSLLDSKSTAYSQLTIRRAFIVWLRCGQKTDFRHVCDYYHRLEKFEEEELSTPQRNASRNLELSLYVHQPAMSPYQQSMFPNLYSSSNVHMAVYQQLYVQKHYPETNSEQQRQQEIFEASQFFQHANQNSAHATPTPQQNGNSNGVKIVELNNQGEENVLKNKSSKNNITKNDLMEFVDTKIKLEELNKHKAAPKRKITKITPEEIFASSQVFKSENLKNTGNGASVKDEVFENNSRKLELLGQRAGITKAEPAKGTPTQHIVQTSEMINEYCKERRISLRNFIQGFNEYASRCQLSNTVNNISFYIKRNQISEELKAKAKLFGSKTKKNRQNGKQKNKSNKTANLAPKGDKVNTDDEKVGNLDKVDISVKVLKRSERKTPNAFLNSSNIAKTDGPKYRKI